MNVQCTPGDKQFEAAASDDMPFKTSPPAVMSVGEAAGYGAESVTMTQPIALPLAPGEAAY